MQKRGRISKKEQAAIRREAAQGIEYCWVTTCYRLSPCPHHLPFNDPRNLAKLIRNIESELKAIQRERLIPCLLPLYQALDHEWAETKQLEIKSMDREFEGEREAARVKERIGQLIVQSERPPQFVPEFQPTIRLDLKFQHIVSVAEKRIARQFESIQRLANKYSTKNDELAQKTNDLVKKTKFSTCQVSFFQARFMLTCIRIIRSYVKFACPTNQLLQIMGIDLQTMRKNFFLFQ